MGAHSLVISSSQGLPFAFPPSPPGSPKESSSRGALCRISQLPLELLALIFETAERSQHLLRPGSRPLPLIISHVCSEWRSLACALSSLWRDIRVTLWGPTDLWLLFLARSNHRSFDLTVFPGVLKVPLPPGGVPAMLLGHMERCRTITLVTTIDDVLQGMLAALARLPLPILSELHVQHFNPHWAGQFSRVVLSSIAAPRLAILRVKNVAWDWRTTALDGLTTLELCIPFDAPRMALPLAGFRAVVAAAPRLCHLGLVGAPILMDINPLPAVSIPSLRTLEFDVVQSLGLSQKVSDMLETPNLESLTLSRDLAGMAMTLRGRSLTARGCRYPKLRELKLSFVNAFDLRFLDSAFTDACPRLEHLQLLNVDVRGSMQLLAQIRPTLSHGGRLHWPGLRTLTLEKRPVFDVVSSHMLVGRNLALTDAEVVGIASMLSLRRGLGAPLKLLRLQSSVFGQSVRVVRDLERFATVEWIQGPNHLPSEIYL
jgi:hypothetical protein